jgi:tetratricopeptide (TPR) repeat protein
VKAAQVNREIEADYLLKGTVRRFAENVRITIELTEVASGANVLGQRYDRRLDDVLMVQDDLAGRIASSIELKIYAAEGTRAGHQAPHAMDARACLMRAMSLINIRSSRNYASAHELLKRAIQLDPDCSQAYSLSAYVMALEVVYGWRSRDNTMGAALDAARNAIILDPDAPWGHLALGYVHAQSRSTEDAIRNYEKALALNPNFALAHTYLGSAYSVLGRSEAALAQIDIAERLTSREMFCGVNNYVRANAHFAAGRYDEASVCARNSVRESPGIVTSHRHVVVNCALGGAVPEAPTALKDLSRLVPGMSLRSINEALPYVRDQDRNRFMDAFCSLGID